MGLNFPRIFNGTQARFFIPGRIQIKHAAVQFCRRGNEASAENFQCLPCAEGEFFSFNSTFACQLQFVFIVTSSFKLVVANFLEAHSRALSGLNFVKVFESTGKICIENSTAIAKSKYRRLGIASVHGSFEADVRQESHRCCSADICCAVVLRQSSSIDGSGNFSSCDRYKRIACHKSRSTFSVRKSATDYVFNASTGNQNITISLNVSLRSHSSCVCLSVARSD